MPPEPDTAFTLTAEALRARRGAKWHRFEDDVLPAWVADMDFHIAPAVQRAIDRVTEPGDYGYALRVGPDTVGWAFADRMRTRFGWEVDPELTVEVTDLIQGLTASLLAFSSPGDGVVVQTPIYPPFLQTIDDVGRTRVENPLRDNGSRFVLDREALAGQIDDRTRVLLVCNPHNPTGRVLERSELEALGRIALERDLVIVADEIHSDLVYPGGRHVPLGTLDQEVAARTITMNSATKGFNIPGLRCGLLHFGSADLLDRFHRTVPPRLLGRPSCVGVDATVAAWREGQPWLDGVLDLLAANRDVVGAWAAGQPGVRHHRPEATFLAWLDFAALELPLEPHDFLLESARVGLNRGGDFGTLGACCARLNFGTSPEILRSVLNRISGALEGSRRGAG
jgi:cystathionine beta-lyase